MQYSIALLSLAAAVYASPSGAPIPTCGWTSTIITESDHTETVPIPMASPDCSSSAAPASYSSAPVTSSAVYSSSASAVPYSSSVIACTEYVDGQPQCSAVPVVCSEYVDGQPQCSSAAPVAVCSEYVDGQPQCYSSSAVPVCSEYVDGQPQCASSAAATGYYPSGSGYATGTGVVPYASSSYAPVAATAPAAMPTVPAVGLLGALLAAAVL